MGVIYTAGYERRSLAEFVSLLSGAGVQCLADIRANPISRKKGFSKTALSDAVKAHGITYRHLGGLGGPKDLRDQVHKTGDYQEFFSRYEREMLRHPDLLKELEEIARECKVCLVCFELDPNCCHRSVVARYLAEHIGAQIQHL